MTDRSGGRKGSHVADLLAAALLLMTPGCTDGVQASCFAADTVLPQRAATLADPALGQSARDLAAALFDRDLERAEILLKRDAALARVRVGPHHDMLIVALATCDTRAVELLLRHGAPRDGRGDGLPLQIALRANDPALAHALLTAGASPNPRAQPTGPLRTAIGQGSLGGVRMLLDFGADPDVAEETGHRPLHIALDQERFRIAELLLDRGADAWAIDSGGANLGSSTAAPMLTASADEAAAQKRLAARLPKLGWSDPLPSPQQIRDLALGGQWPPRASGAPEVPQAVLEIIAANAGRQGFTAH